MGFLQEPVPLLCMKTSFRGSISASLRLRARRIWFQSSEGRQSPLPFGNQGGQEPPSTWHRKRGFSNEVPSKLRNSCPWAILCVRPSGCRIHVVLMLRVVRGLQEIPLTGFCRNLILQGTRGHARQAFPAFRNYSCPWWRRKNPDLPKAAEREAPL